MNKSNKMIIVIIIVMLGLVSYIIYSKNSKSKGAEYEEHKEYEEPEYVEKKYGVNQYSKISVDDNQMAIAYFSDYQQYLLNNIDKAYEYVDPEYANRKCNDISSFKRIVENKFESSSVKNYKKEKHGDYYYYIIQDTENNIIVFKVDGVMNYTVYLDNETVVIDR